MASCGDPALLHGIVPRETVSRLVPDSPLLRWFSPQWLPTFQCLATGANSKTFLCSRVSDCTSQGAKRVFLIVSDGQACVFPHARTWFRTLRRVCSCILVPDCASHAVNDATRSVRGMLLVTRFALQCEHNSAAPESRLVLRRLIWRPLWSCAVRNRSCPAHLEFRSS